MNQLHSIILAITLLVGGVSVAAAQDFDKGFEAALSGDFETALREWRPLAEQGDYSSQHNLGVMYSEGQGVLQDYSEAVRWYRLSAEQGYASSQYNLGNMYFEGQGVLKDYSEAVRWYRLSAEQGHASAQNNLGNRYYWGEGVLQSKVLAHMWYNMASANGNSGAGEWRDETADIMTIADISLAQQMARECMSSNYQNCGE